MRINSFSALSTVMASIAIAGAPISNVDAATDTQMVSTTMVAQVHAQFPGVYRYRIGDFQVTALSDGTVAQDVHALLTNTTSSEIDELLAHEFLSSPVETSINAFLIDTGSRLLLVDTGAGSLFGPGNGGKLLGNLKAAGYSPEQIDDILLTHIHPDHSGGLVSNGQLVFPNATIYVGKPDVELFLDPANIHGANGYDKIYFEYAVKTIEPYVKAGKVVAFSSVTQVHPGVTAIPTPGHTPGHSFYRIESNGASIEFIGDIVHVAPVQFTKPHIAILYDVSPNEAIAERKMQFRLAVSQRKLVAGTHLPFPGLGRIRGEAHGVFSFVPVNYHDREEH